MGPFVFINSHQMVSSGLRMARQLKPSLCAQCQSSPFGLKYKKVCSNCYNLRFHGFKMLWFRDLNLSETIWLRMMDYCFANEWQIIENGS